HMFQYDDEFGHHFNENITGNTTIFGDARIMDFPGDSKCITANLANVHRLTFSSVDNNTSGSLYPDGAYSEVSRQLRYHSTNLGDPATIGFVGAIEMWVKPNYDTAHPSRPRQYFCYPEHMGVEGYGGVSIFYMGGDQTEESQSITPCVGTGRRVPLSRNCFITGWASSVVGAGYGFGSGWTDIKNTHYRSSTSANHRWHLSSDEDSSLTRLYQFESRRWNHFAFAWDLAREEMDDNRSSFTLNGRVVDENPSGFHGAAPWTNGYLGLFTYFNNSFDLNVAQFGSIPKWFNLGSKYGNNHVTPPIMVVQQWEYDDKYQGWNGADSTYDDVIGYLDMQTPASLGLGYALGRYYNEPAASGILGTYTSPQWHLKYRQRMRLRSTSWTLWWPENNRATDSDLPDLQLQAANANDLYPDDTVLAEQDAIGIDIAAGGNWHYEDCYGDVGTALTAMPTYAGGSSCKFENGDPYDFFLEPRQETFRFKIHFLLESGQVVYDAPVLDDITFCFEYAKPKVINWRILLN
ncbi:hypothetical protein ACFL54_03350, partial [Planctomycetota bacterium]